MWREEPSVLSDGGNLTTRFLFDLKKKTKTHCSSDSTDGPNWKAASYVIDSHVHVHNGSLIAMGVPCEVECWSGKEKEIVETLFEHL